MTDNFLALEQRLIEVYQAQLRLYDRALGVIAQAAPDSAGSSESVQRIRCLNSLLRDIAALDAPLAEDKAVCRFSGHRPGPQLRRGP